MGAFDDNPFEVINTEYIEEEELAPVITKKCDTCDAVIHYRSNIEPIKQCVDCRDGVTDFTSYIARMNPQRKIIQPTDVRDFDYFEDKKKTRAEKKSKVARTPKYVKKAGYGIDLCEDCNEQIVYDDKPRKVYKKKQYCSKCVWQRKLARVRKRYAEKLKKPRSFICIDCKKEFGMIGKSRKRCDECNVINRRAIHRREYKRKQAEVKKNVVE